MSTDNLDLDRLESVIPIARNNHMEVVITPDELEALIAAARERDAVVEAVRALAERDREISEHNASVSVHQIADLIKRPTARDYLNALDAATREKTEGGAE